MSNCFIPEQETLRSEYDGEKEINVYDNDDAYMLNSGGEDNPDVIYSFDDLQYNDNDEDITAARGYKNEVKELTDNEGTVRGNHNFSKHDEGMYMQEIPNSKSSNNLKTLQYISICQNCKENF